MRLYFHLSRLSIRKTQTSSKMPGYRKLLLTLSLVFCCYFFIGCLVVNLILLLFGHSTFYDKANIVQIIYSFIGNIFVLWFLLSSWKHTNLWWIWGVFGYNLLSNLF